MKETLKNKLDAWFCKDYRATFMERVLLVLESETLFAGEPDAIRYAKTLEYVLEGISIPLGEDDVFAGTVTERIPTGEEHDAVLAVYKKWWDIPLEERHKKTLFYYSEGWLKCRPPWFVSYGHLALDWEGIIRRGLGDFKARAEEVLGAQTEPDKKAFEQGLLISYKAISNYILRYAARAREQGRETLSASLEYIATGPARSFFEALSLIWFITLICQKVCGCGVLRAYA